MSWILDIVNPQERKWEEFYRNRWAHDNVIRSTHGVNCTGGCSWAIYVKDGIVTWEMQQTDYPLLEHGLPPYEPRGCQRGISASWYVYSPIRVKYPYVRGPLLDFWREAKSQHSNPVEAWGSLVEDQQKRSRIQQARGKGGYRRAKWDEVSELIAAACPVHGAQVGAGPGDGLLADPGDVVFLLCGGFALPPAVRRREHELLRLVRRPADLIPGSLGRPDRRVRKRGLVQQHVHRLDGVEPEHDPHPGRALHLGGAHQWGQVRSARAGLQPSRQVLRRVDPDPGGTGRRAMDGGQSRYPQGVLRRPPSPLFPRLPQALHRLSVPRRTGPRWEGLSRGAVAARQSLGALQRRRKRRLEDAGTRRQKRRAAHAQGHGRLSLASERERQVEPLPGGRPRQQPHRCSAELHRSI